MFHPPDIHHLALAKLVNPNLVALLDLGETVIPLFARLPLRPSPRPSANLGPDC